MKYIAVFCLLLVACFSPVAFCQTESVVNPLPTWNVSADASALHVFSSQFDSHGTTTIYGWRGTASEYPYAASPWIGGTVQIAGYYDTVSVAGSSPFGAESASGSTSLYTFMLGPSLRARKRGIQPFASPLIGVVSEHNGASSTTVGTIPITGSGSSSSTHLGIEVGGGVDFPISSRWGVHVQGSWLRAFMSGNSTDLLESSGGLAYRF